MHVWKQPQMAISDGVDVARAAVARPLAISLQEASESQKDLFRVSLTSVL